MIQNFRDFNLNEDIIKGLDDMKFSIPTQIQEKAIPFILNGDDLVGLAQTGTGKTATFSLPILQKLLTSEKETKTQHPRALILAPTRELCAQIGKNLISYTKYCNISSYVAFGGVSSEPQIEALKGKIDVLVATPGRLVDLVEQKNVFLD